MLKREAVWKALVDAWPTGPTFESAFDKQADAILALLPSPEEIGRAAESAVLRYGMGMSHVDLGRAILEELRKGKKP